MLYKIECRYTTLSSVIICGVYYGSLSWFIMIWLSGLMWDGLVPGVPASCITVFQRHMREKTCTLVFSQKCTDALIHCQVKCCFSFKKHLWDSMNQRNDWGEIEDELMTLSNNTGGRSTPTHCKRYSQWEWENETQSYGCLCRIPSSLISLKPLFGCCTEKNSCVNQAKEGNADSHKAYVPCVVDWQIISLVFDTHSGNVRS